MQPHPSLVEAHLPRLAQLPERALDQSDPLLEGSLPGEVADDLSLEALTGYRKRRRKPKVGIVLLLGEARMHHRVLAVRVHSAEQKVVGEPGALQIIEPQAVGQQAMRRLVREDRQSKLPRADYCNGEHKGERAWPPYEHGHRAKYHPP